MDPIETQNNLNSDNAEIKEAFDLIDKSHLGKINKEQLETLMKILGFDPPDSCFQGQDPSEEYNLSDVVTFINTKIKPNNVKFEGKEFLDKCRAYDPDNTGFITIPQMAKVLKHFDASSEEEYLETMRLGEFDYGENVYYKEFLRMMMM